MIILLTIIVALLSIANGVGPNPRKQEPKTSTDASSSSSSSAKPMELDQVLETEEEKMHKKNIELLSTWLGNYLRKKINAKKSSKANEKERLDFEKEKSVWTTPEGSHGFSVRAEKLFERITNKFRITDEMLLKSLSEFLPLKHRGGSGGVFYITKDSKYIVKSLNDNHDEPEKMDQVLDKYVKYVLTKGEKSMMNRFHLNFKMTLDAKLKEVIKPKELQFVVLNNTFYGIEPEKLLKFDIKGTFSPGSAVQYDQKQTWYKKDKSPGKSTYREYDFMGIARGDRDVKAFFKNGIELDKTEYTQLTEVLHNDAQYLSANELNDYSLLLGVHFLDKAPKNNNNNCIHAICRDCKRLPDAAYNKPEEQQHLCLYMAIVDIVTPSTKKAEEHFLQMLAKHRSSEFGNITTMADFNGFQLETVSPIPAPQYVGRFLGTVLGCIFRPAFLPGNNQQILMNGLSQAICHSFGEEREPFVAKSKQKFSGGKPWYEHEEFQSTNSGVVVYGLELFKEMMDKWKTPSWNLLYKTPGEFTIKQISKNDFSVSLENLINDGETTSSQKYYAIFSHKEMDKKGQIIQKYYGLVRDEENPHAGKKQ